MDNGQCKKSHFQEKVNTHKGLSGESGGQSGQKFGATQRGKLWYINLEFLSDPSPIIGNACHSLTHSLTFSKNLMALNDAICLVMS